MSNESGWLLALEKYCEEFNIPKENLADILQDPKVNPMIRGKGFEYTALQALQKSLNPAKYEVSKPNMNAQSMQHDVDILVTHKPTGKTISVECKLSGKGSFKKSKLDEYYSTVKCMRSRTLGEELIKTRAPLLGVSEPQLRAHKDSYLFSDFDLVVSSLANAFYETDKETGAYVWNPSQDHKDFLKNLLNESENNLQHATFNYILVAKAFDVAPIGGFTKCNRKDCKHKEDCPFIPNYPVVNFDKINRKPVEPWHSISNIESLIEDILGKK
jgi:hypothetical protein